MITIITEIASELSELNYFVAYLNKVNVQRNNI